MSTFKFRKTSLNRGVKRQDELKNTGLKSCHQNFMSHIVDTNPSSALGLTL